MLGLGPGAAFGLSPIGPSTFGYILLQRFHSLTTGPVVATKHRNELSTVLV